MGRRERGARPGDPVILWTFTCCGHTARLGSEAGVAAAGRSHRVVCPKWTPEHGDGQPAQPAQEDR